MENTRECKGRGPLQTSKAKNERVSGNFTRPPFHGILFLLMSDSFCFLRDRVGYE